LVIVSIVLEVTLGSPLACDTPELPSATLPPGFCATVWASGLWGPRGIAVAANNDLLVVEALLRRISVLWNDGKNSATLASASGLNHGIEIDGPNSFLYASSSTTVFRWKYSAGDRSDLGTATTVITGVPCCHHNTRTLRIINNYLYVQSGSGSNVDSDSTHSQIRRFPLSSLNGTSVSWLTGELFADGLRNEVGLRQDSNGNIWGVENGVDNLFRTDLGGDIHTDNPSEEVNLFAQPGKFYGYPYCWSEFNLSTSVGGGNPGNQWVHSDFQNKGIYNDNWCKNQNNVARPKFNMQAHTAPLDILFWNGTTFPTPFKQGGAFVAQHGSWNRNPAVGYRVDYLAVAGTDVLSLTTLLKYVGPGATGRGWIRPAGLAQISCPHGECLIISSDSTGTLISVYYNA